MRHFEIALARRANHDKATWGAHRPLFLFAILSALCLPTTGGHAEKPGIPMPTVQERIVATDSAAGKHYLENVQPLLEKRCVVCHGCYDSPCQFNQGAPEGLNRGASVEKIYNAGRRSAMTPSRLLSDARSTPQWRDRGFFPMLNEYEQTPEANLQNSVMHHMLALKREHPLPQDPILDRSFDLALNRNQECPKLEEIEAYKVKRPLWGMPYGLPGLSDAEHSLLEDWLRDGSPMAHPAPPGEDVQAAVDRWEQFLNGDSRKEQLMTRYLFEHWFLAHLHFPGVGDGEYFRIVRSSTPPGEPISHLPTRRPYDDPGVKRVYYRLWRDHSTVLDKTHMPYALHEARMAWLRELFLDADYEVAQLPSYAPEVAANPFVAFRKIPVANRWQFLIEEAQYTIMNFIKGPVCRGQTSLNVIRDHFWVFFANPHFEMADEAVEFLNSQEHNLRMPTAAGSDVRAIAIWKSYSRSQKAYLEAKSKALTKHFPGGEHLTLDLVWGGDGDNSNAALTVFRHFDSASVVRGLVGDEPLSAWLVDYPILERIHYLLVAGFDVFGAGGHQLSTRAYMDFLRLEGEFNFLALLPPETRLSERARWYEGASKKQQSYLFGSRAEFNEPSGITYQSDDPKQELIGMLRDKLTPVLNTEYELDQLSIPPAQRRSLQTIAAIQGRPASFLPEVVFINVTAPSGADHYYTMLHNRAHSNVTSLFREKKYLKPDEDTVTVVNGFIGSYPDAYWVVTENQLPVLANRLQRLSNEGSYRVLIDQFGVRRTSPQFWQHSDKMLEAHHAANPLENGLLDYNRIENR